MGHYWRDIDPVGAAKQDMYWERVHAARASVANIPLSAFSVQDLGPLMRVLGLKEEKYGNDASDEDLTYVEKKVIAYNSSLRAVRKPRRSKNIQNK